MTSQPSRGSSKGIIARNGGDPTSSLFRFDTHELDPFDLPGRGRNQLVSGAGMASANRKARIPAGDTSQSFLPPIAGSKSRDGDDSLRSSPVSRQQPSSRAASRPRMGRVVGTRGSTSMSSELMHPPSEGDGFGVGAAAASTAAAAAAAVGGDDSGGEVFRSYQQLRTGEDVVSFFARYGANCPIKFVHLNRAPASRTFRPYDLVVVPEEKLNPEHFTMSAKGIVHVCPGQPSEFLSLAEWMRQASTFSVVRQLSFFREFIPRKVFDTWRAFSKYSIFCKRRESIRRDLFRVSPAFADGLREVQAALSQIQDVKLLNLASSKFNTQTFAEAQNTVRSQAQRQVDKVLVRVVRSLKHICKDVTDRAATAGPDDDEEADAIAGRDGKAKSMREIKEERKQKRQALRQALLEESQLGSLIRTVDTLCLESLCERCIDELREWYNAMAYPDQQRSKAGIFFTELRFDDEGTFFVPSCDEYLSMVDDVVRDTVELISNEPRILSVKAFERFLHDLPLETRTTDNPISLHDLDDPVGDTVIRERANELARAAAPLYHLDHHHQQQQQQQQQQRHHPLGLGSPSAAELLYSGKSLRILVADLKAKFQDDFYAAEQFASMDNFRAVRPVFDFQRTVDIDSNTAQDHSVSELRKDMARIAGWGEAVRGMIPSSVRGSLWVDAKELRAQLEPVTETALSRIKASLVRSAHQQCKEVLDAFTERAQVLSTEPASLPEFASHQERLNQLILHENMLMSQAQTVDDMYKLIKAYGGKVSTLDELQLDEMHQATERYEEARMKGTAYMESQLSDMKQQLDMRIIRMNEQLSTIEESLREGEFVDPNASPEKVLESLQSTRERLRQLEDQAKRFRKWQKLFRMSEYDFHPLQRAIGVWEKRHQMWQALHEFETQHRHWTQDPFRDIDVNEVARETQALVKVAVVCDRHFGDAVSNLLKERVMEWRHQLPVVEDLGNPFIQDRHWERLYQELGHSARESRPDRTLQELFDMGILERRDLAEETAGTASGEHQLEEGLRNIRDEWESTNFVVKEYREQKHVYVLGGLEDIFTMLEDHQVTLQTMMGNRFVAGVRDEVEEWDRKLSLLSDTLDEWVACQRQWQYLENIFSAEDIQRQLPAESSKFMSVDKRWKEAMLRTHTNPAVLAAIENGDDLLHTFQQCNSLLEEIQKSLDDYLETKRAAFPRFYFLSDDDLLAILSQTRVPQAVQPHLQGCFDAIKRLDFGEDEEDAHEIYAMNSNEGEKVPFSAPVSAVGNVEHWLTDVETMMRTSLYNRTKEALLEYPDTPEGAVNRGDWLFKHPAQVVLAVDQIQWTANCTRAIEDIASGKDAAALEKFLEFSKEQIDAMVSLVRGELTPLQRTLMGALVVLDVHARDVVHAMIDKKVSSMEDFEWTRQLRYYWEGELDNCVVRQTNTRFLYGYEYLGNTGRLVITPLTDKCYMTLTGALHLKFGGAPAGPAGTGKTETTKDLSKVLAVQCVVFNCSDSLDAKMMARFFSGLAQCGAWACFDEFNRLDIEVLSVVAQQILTIQQGLMMDEPAIEFEGKEIPLNPAFGVFITMNPGYAGRTELPDNLKALFRPVAMMVPDYRLIAEIILFSEGFSEAYTLSSKMVQLYKLASEQLSKQSHYDFGMRAVKSVLVAAGQLKRKEPEVREDLLLIRAMRDSNVPKFLEDDLPLFQGIIQDLFPGVEVPFVDYGKLQEAIEHQLRLAGFQVVPSLVSKIIQTHETQLVRHGMMIVGAAGCGKTTNSATLARALTQLKRDGVVDMDGFYQTVHRYILNPKAVRMAELYGEISRLTGEWTPGIVAELARIVVEDTSKDRKWLVFDGPVDALWIENMNTVLDDNKMLCLANGQRIKLPSTVHMMFEVEDLAVASPATVSRCGMVYQEDVHLGIQALLDAWLEGEVADLLPEEMSRLTDLVHRHVPALLEFVRESCEEVIPSKDINLVQSFLSLLLHLLRPEQGIRGRGWRKEPRTAAQKVRERFGYDQGHALADATGIQQPQKQDGGSGEGKGGMSASSSSNSSSTDDGEEEKTTEDDAAEKRGEDGEEREDEEEDEGGFTPAAMDELNEADIDAIDAELEAEESQKLAEGAMQTWELQRMVNALFTFSAVWSFGANLQDDCRARFGRFVQKQLSSILPREQSAAGADMYDFFVDVPRRRCASWSSVMRSFRYDPEVPYFNLVVPTSDTTRFGLLFEMISHGGRHVLFTGETGVGKSVILMDSMRGMCKGDESSYVYSAMNLSAQTQSSNIVDALESSLEQKRKTLLGAPAGKKMLLLVDDLNMPALEVYGAQPPIELLRQVIDQGGFYDTKRLFFKRVADCVLAAACAPPGGGRNPITPRLLRHFHMLWLPSLSRTSMCRIFSAILGGFLHVTAPSLAQAADSLVSASTDVYLDVQEVMLPTPAKSHYTFNLRDLSKVFQGILMVDTEQLKDGSSLLRLWLHESQRVFRDRLVNDEDRSWFNDAMYQQVLGRLRPIAQDDLSEDALEEAQTVGDRRWKAKHPEDVEAAAEKAGGEEAKEGHEEKEGDDDDDDDGGGGGHDGEAGEGDADVPSVSEEGMEEWAPSTYDSILFGDYLTQGDRRYSLVPDPTKLPDLFSQQLEEYNVTYPNPMHLVFFQDAVGHVSRIARVLRQPRGNAMLVGVGGSGRQSLTRLAAFMAGCECLSVEITRSYGPDAWHDDLKRVLMAAGTKAKDVVFLFSDTQIKDESFLEDINNLLNSGDVPNLYAPDEVEEIVNEVRPLAREAGVMDTRDAIFDYYVHLVREHLHIVLAFSPIGNSFRTRCQQFPSLVNCTTIDWYNAWPEDALFSVAKFFLGRGENEEGEELGIQGSVDALCDLSVHIHRSVEDMSGTFLAEQRRHNYTTPTSYLELIKLYSSMLQEQREHVNGRIRRYRGGLSKLRETNEMVQDLEVKLRELQPTLERAAQDTEQLLERLAVDQKEADQAAEQAARDEADTKKKADEVAEIKDDCQRDLDEALPSYYEALAAVDSLDRRMIQEVKAFSSPPKLVQTVMEAVCVLLEHKPTWEEAKKVLSDMRFLERLRDYDKDNIDPKIIRKVMKYYNDPSFKPSDVEKVSKAAKCLCMWVRAMVDYDRVAKNIAPKRERLRQAEESLEEAQRVLAEKQAALKEVQDRVAKLKRDYEDSLAKKEELEERQQTTEARLARAHRLTDGLGNESERWTSAVEQLETDLRNLVGNMILGAGCVAYAGPFTAEYRQRLTSGWVDACREQSIPVDAEFDLTRVLADPVEVREWNMQGLPADPFSVENGLFATRGRRWPLMIDPQGQANRWVKNLQKDNGLQVIKLSQSDFLRSLENGIRFGQPVLLENVEEELDPSLEPVLQKQVFKKQGLMTLRLGDNDVPYSDDFRFYITTKLSNPHYLPEVCVKVTVINFTVTRKGLEDQLLVDVVAHERPELEERKDQLIVSIANDKKQLKSIEDRILKMLAEASGDILDDEELINSLAKSKETSTAIGERMEEAERTTKQINEAREEYRPVATRGSLLYFVIADLANVDPMYQYSLQAFTRLYNLRIQKSETHEELEQRLSILIDDLTRSFYANMCRGLFEKHKLLYSFLISVRIFKHKGDISDDEWSFFMIGTQQKDDGGRTQFPPTKSWLPAKAWLQILALDGLGAFQGIADDIGNQCEEWRDWACAPSPETTPLPAPWNGRLGPFQRLMVLRAIREEKTLFGMREYVREVLGAYFCEPPPFDLEGAFRDSFAETPIIFVLSPGADPIDYLLRLAKEKGKDGPSMRVISLGQGQGPHAERAMEEARRSGDWVCLQNCHLAASWLPRLEAVLEQMTEPGAAELHPEFRLWLTSMPSNKFPVPILQNGIKITNEPPRGLKANLKRIFLDMSEEEYERCSKPRPFKKLLFGLAFYHALILERRKFGAIGWNIPYEWMNSDLKTGIMQVRMYLEEQPEVPYETLNAIVGDITYGGRVTDAWDKRTNLSILRRFFCPELMDDSFTFSESGVYRAPPEGPLEDVRNYIETLPWDDAPETFGLHENANITLQQKETRELMATVVSMQPRAAAGGSGSGGQDPNDIVLAIADNVLERLPAPFDKRNAHPSTFATIADGTMNSLGVFAEQEMNRFNRLTEEIRSSLEEMKRAIRGLVVMSPQLETMHECFLRQRVPPRWENAAYPSLKPLSSWIEDLFARLAFLDTWLRNGPPPTFWMSGFFFPQGFMTGALQTHARKTKIPIDTLTVRTEVLGVDETEVSEPPDNGVYIYGLYMEGARWDRTKGRVAEMHPSELFCRMPVIWLEPVRESDHNPGESYQCPVYKTSRRAGTLSTTGHSTNFIVALHLPSNVEQDHWVRRGVALLSQLDD